jgi:adhesin transport system membrane fusion protein
MTFHSPALDEAFANDIRGALDARRQTSLAPLIGVVVLLIGAFLAWAATAELEEVTTGMGQVMPTSQMQLVQPFEAGIVRDIAVAEGDVVEAGDVLLVIDDTDARSTLGELQERQQALSMQQIRLLAEARGEQPAFPTGSAPDIVDGELQLYEARQLALAQQIGVVSEQLQQRTFEREELLLQIEETETSIGFLERELELNRRLYDRGAIGEVEFLRRERAAANEQRALAVLRAGVPRAEAAIEESRRQLATIDIQFRATARQELTAVIADLAVIDQSLRSALERVERTRMRAPVRGIVNALPVTTLGAVIRPGESVVEIVPLDDQLLVEAEVRPQDIAFISAGQDASVKLTAYDYTVYGDLSGVVERISADTFEDEQGNTFYRVIIGLEDNRLRDGGEVLPIIPGMVVTADILTGSKTVLDYLLNPVTRARNEALRER